MTIKNENNYIIQIPISKAENIRLYLNKEKKLDKKRKIKKVTIKNEIYLLIPVKHYMHDFLCYCDPLPQYYHKISNLISLLDDKLSLDELSYIPSSWHIIGNIIIVTISEKLNNKVILIAEALLQLYPKCTSVVRDMGIKGELRLPQREILIGNDTETVHKENGCFFKLDVTKVMFSKGNQQEKKLLILKVKNEIIVDMFAGIGYFSIPLAVHSSPKKIIAIELNPISYNYLVENIRLNKVKNIVEPVLGNCQFKTPKSIADRVIMGYIGNTHYFLKNGIEALKKSGGILHYHETTPEFLINIRPVNRIKTVAAQLDKQVEILEIRRIKKYSPGVWHIVIDARIY